jgi:hypothetical protein
LRRFDESVLFSGTQAEFGGFCCAENTPGTRKVFCGLIRQVLVPRDRIELSTPAFSGPEESEQDQIDKLKVQCKK